MAQPRMDFFADQERARRRSLLLFIPILFSVVAISCVSYAAVVLLRFSLRGKYDHSPFEWWNPTCFWITAFVCTVVIAVVSINEILRLKNEGGNWIAHSLGGKLVRYDTSDLGERRLINIVEELSIASGVPVPEIFVLREQGINSFCAGHEIDSACLVITQGALDLLNRDELQAILAHEFSHILNGDMRVNTRLVGLLHGFMAFSIAGRSICGFGYWGWLAGILLMLAGYIGRYWGTVVQALVCRQREWLADAHAIQFTRNPGAIVSALKKIGGYAYGSSVPRPYAIGSAHLFFANAIDSHWFWRTHPPLTNRIRKIDRFFNGVFPIIKAVAPLSSAALWRADAASRKPYLAGGVLKIFDMPDKYSNGPVLPPAEIFLRPKEWPRPEPEPPTFAAVAMDALPSALCERVRSGEGARLVTYALLHESGREPVASKQAALIAASLSEAECERFASVVLEVRGLSPVSRLPLVMLALAGLRNLSPVEVAVFLRTVDGLALADGTITPYEYALRQIVLKQLRPPSQPQWLVMNLGEVLPQISTLMSAVAQSGAPDDEAAARAFAAGAKFFNEGLRRRLIYIPACNVQKGAVIDALRRLEVLIPVLKKPVLAALFAVVKADGKNTSEELDMLSTIAVSLNCPAPVSLSSELIGVPAAA